MTDAETEAAPPLVVNADEVAEIADCQGEHWGGTYKPLTPALSALPGRLGANISRVPPGRSGCPFHTHALADEIFFVLSGRGVLRYGEELREIRQGDCISCPAGTGIAHQIANPFEQDLVYLCIGRNDPNEVCTYPDSGKIMVESLKQVGYLRVAPYYEGEPELPKILQMAAGPG